MLLMDQLQVIKGDLSLLGPHATLGPLVALLRGTLEVDDLSAVHFGHLLETAVERLEDLMFGLVHVAEVLHQLREDVLISKDTPLTDLDLIGVALGSFVQFLHSSEDGVDLEGKAPSLGLDVVFLQHVDLLAAQVLPLRDRFFDPSGLGHALTQQLDDGRLPATDVALNREVELGQLGVHHSPFGLYLGLVGISRQELHELNFKLPPKKGLITHAQFELKMEGFGRLVAAGLLLINLPIRHEGESILRSTPLFGNCLIKMRIRL